MIAGPQYMENYSISKSELKAISAGKRNDSNNAFSICIGLSGSEPVILDVAKIPVMLISGAAGTGKTCFVQYVMTSLMEESSPDDFRMIIFDSKGIDYLSFNHSQYLLLPVLSDMAKLRTAMQWALSEVRYRLSKFPPYHARNLEEYNARSEERLPEIFIVIDDFSYALANLGDSLANILNDLQQLCRSVGLHIILCASSPVTLKSCPEILSNIQNRISFYLPTRAASKYALDIPSGAELLHVPGEIIYKGPAVQKICKTVFMTTQEIDDFLDKAKNAYPIESNSAEEIEKIITAISNEAKPNDDLHSDISDYRDEHFVEAGYYIIDSGKASVGMLQRIFKIGFNRALRIMKQLEEAGVVSKEEGAKPRTVLMSREKFEQYIEQNSI
jgi:S-DNA-T family DNA segregation ATPase FtsK/SpoIIIE